MFIVDVLRYDIEQISNIVNLLNATGGVGWRVFWSRDFNVDEVLQALKQLLAAGLVDLYIGSVEDRDLVPYDGQITSLEQARALWFRLTERGWAAWENWEDYPVSDEDQRDV